MSTRPQNSDGSRGASAPSSVPRFSENTHTNTHAITMTRGAIA